MRVIFYGLLYLDSLLTPIFDQMIPVPNTGARATSIMQLQVFRIRHEFVIHWSFLSLLDLIF
jgi:hypothetical protein